MLNPNGASQPATRGNIEAVGIQLQKDIAAIEIRLHGVETNMATRANLQAAETRLQKDIEAIKIQLQNVETNVAAQADIQRGIAAELVRARYHLQNLEANMSTKEDISRLFNVMDKFAQKAVVYDHKALSHGDILADHESRLRGHDRRLGTLEGKA